MSLRNLAVLLAAVAILPVAIRCQSPPDDSAASQPGAAPPNQTAWLQYIYAELRHMHLEMLQDRLEYQQNKNQDIERELEANQAQQRQLQEEQHAQAQQAVQVEEQLSQPTLSKGEREELEARRADLASISPNGFGSAQNALTQREARLRDRLALQEQRIRAIEQQIRELSSRQ